MKKILSIILAVVLVFTTISVMAFAEGIKGDTDNDGKVTATDARKALRAALGLMELNEIDVNLADVDGDGIVEATDARRILRMALGLDDESDTPSTTLTKAQIVEFFNAETKKASKGNYSFSRAFDFTDAGIDVGDATSAMNSIISAVDPNATLASVTGTLLGMRTVSGEYLTGQRPANALIEYSLIGMELKEDDVVSYTATEGEYVLQLKPCKNPQKDGGNALHHVTRDFLTHKNILSMASSVVNIPGIAIEKTDMDYKDIILTVKLENDMPTSLEISYIMDIEIDLKVADNAVVGKGTAEYKMTYSNLDY